MGAVLGGLGGLIGLVSFVCFVMTEIKMFQDEANGGTVKGIAGILTCGIYAFIWGWMNAAAHDHKKVMIAWTVAIILSLVFNGAAAGMNA